MRDSQQASYVLIALVCGLYLSAVTSWGATVPAVSFSRYQVILDRMPFGEPPPVPVVSNDPISATPPPNAFINDLRMCGITDTEYGVRVGLVNIKSKPQKSYFLYLGESEDGIELIDADYGREGALLSKDGEEYWVYMSGVPTTASATARPATDSAKPRERRPRRTSYAQRLREKREAEAARLREQAVDRASGEELVEKLKDYQMEVIRKGMPPLPIPLTKEMDDKLVAEGVLPPLE